MVVVDSLIDAGELAKKRGLVKAYTDVGMYDEIARFILKYSTLQGTQAFRQASKYFEDRAAANGTAGTSANSPPWFDFWYWLDGAERDPNRDRY